MSAVLFEDWASNEQQCDLVLFSLRNKSLQDRPMPLRRLDAFFTDSTALAPAIVAVRLPLLRLILMPQLDASFPFAKWALAFETAAEDIPPDSSIPEILVTMALTMSLELGAAHICVVVPPMCEDDVDCALRMKRLFKRFATVTLAAEASLQKPALTAMAKYFSR
jgi:hypothetical protein